MSTDDFQIRTVEVPWKDGKILVVRGEMSSRQRDQLVEEFYEYGWPFVMDIPKGWQVWWIDRPLEDRVALLERQVAELARVSR
jgi:hypothetical protein